MDDKRIKQITTEMFIAWGMICALFFIIDTSYWHSGIICLSTGDGGFQFLSTIGKTVFIGVLFSNYLCVIISAMILGLLRCRLLEYVEISAWLISFSVLQFILYWFLGNLTGRFIVWIKHLIKKQDSEPVPQKE
jgi:hypothetical protein